MQVECQNNYSVYVHVFPNGKLYIGATRQEPKRRWRGGCGYRNTQGMHDAIQKYGWDNILHIVLVEHLSEDVAMEVEKALIEKYNTQNPDFGYNTKNGGQHFGEHSEEFMQNLKAMMTGNTYCVGRKLSESHKEALRQSNLGKHRPSKYKGIHFHTDESKVKMSVAQKEHWKDPEYRRKVLASKPDMSGKNNPMYGRRHSEETKRKISERKKGGRLSEERRRKLSEREGIKKPVYKLDKDLNILAEFDSVKTAAESVGAYPQNIGFCCKNIGRTSRGFFWRYKEDLSENRGG